MRVQLDCSKPRITDQSFKNVCDINQVMERFRKTGQLPNFPQKTPFYGSNIDAPSLTDAFNIVTTAHEMFYQLPAAIRKDMDNDPTRLEAYLADSSNFEKLAKHGILKAPETSKKDVSDPLKEKESPTEKVNVNE